MKMNYNNDSEEFNISNISHNSKEIKNTINNDCFIYILYSIRAFYFKYSSLYVLSKICIGVCLLIIPLLLTFILYLHNNISLLYLPSNVIFIIILSYFALLIFIKFHRSMKNFSYNFPPWDRKNIFDIVDTLIIIVFIFFIIKKMIFCFTFDFVSEIKMNKMIQSKFEEFLFYFYSYDAHVQHNFHFKYIFIMNSFFYFSLFIIFSNLIFEKKNALFSFIVATSICYEYLSIHINIFNKNFFGSYLPFIILIVSLITKSICTIFRIISYNKKDTLCMKITSIFFLTLLLCGLLLLMTSYLIFHCTNDDKRSFIVFGVGMLLLIIEFAYNVGDKITKLTFKPIEKEFFYQYQNIKHAILLNVNNGFIIRNYINNKQRENGIDIEENDENTLLLIK